MARQNEKEGLRPHKEVPAVFGTLFGYLFPGGLVRKVRWCGEVPQRRAHVTSRIAALADNMADGSLLVAPGHRYKNSHNFVISDQTCLKLFIRALSITIYLPQYIFTLGFLFL